MSLQAVLDKIHRSKERCIPFDEYMAFSLYDPAAGYYTKKSQKIGKSGDFYTSSSVSAIFGYVWSDVFRQTVKKNKLQHEIVEFGAGNGMFADHVLQRWKLQDVTSYQKLAYHIVEESPYHREMIAESTKKHHNVLIHASFPALQQHVPYFQGIVFANELLDAMPVKVIRKQNGALVEMHVGVSTDDTLCEHWKPLAAPYDSAAARRILNSQEGTTGEMPLYMESWLHSLFQWIAKGSAVYFVDYGYTHDEWQQPHVHHGSLRGYRNHQLIPDVLAHTGDMDLTAHVDWDTVREAGDKAGMKNEQLLSQGQFLLKNGLMNFLQDHDGRDPFSQEAKAVRAVRSFLLDSGLSEGFQVLQQVKV